MKKEYKAMATLTDGVKEGDLIIYSYYNRIEEEIDGVSRFASNGYDIVKVWIE